MSSLAAKLHEVLILSVFVSPAPTYQHIMKLKHIALAACIIAVPPLAQAATLVSWTIAGGAWTPSNQPGFTNGAGGGGTLRSDQAIAGDSSSPSLVVTGVTSGGIYDNPSATYYYTLFSNPNFAFSATSADPINQLSLTLRGGIQNTSVNAGFISLNIGGTPYTADGFVAVPPSAPMASDGGYSWTWNLASQNLPASTAVNVSFGNLGNHSALESITFSQVPEPSALLLGGLGALGLLRRRRA